MQATGRGRPPGTLGGPQGGCVGAAGVRFMGTSMCVPHPQCPPHPPSTFTHPCGGHVGEVEEQGDLVERHHRVCLSHPHPPKHSQTPMWGTCGAGGGAGGPRGEASCGILGGPQGGCVGPAGVPRPRPKHTHTPMVWMPNVGEGGGVRLIPTPSTG